MSSNPKKSSVHLVIAPLLLLCPLVAQAKLSVVATLPDLGSLAHEIGRDKVDLVVLGKANEDPHFVETRPNFAGSLHNADVLIDSGAEVEQGWLPPLLQNAHNPKIEVGKPGRVQASLGIRLINVPTSVTRAAGDMHALGNPHFTVDPAMARTIAQHIAKTFATLDAPNARFYDGNYKKFEATINAKLKGWGAIMQTFQDQHLVAYHDSWPYFGHRFGLKIDVFLEPKPGIPPSPSHLTDVIQKMKENHIKAIMVEPYQDRRIAEKIARSTEAKVIDVSQFPGGIPGTGDYVTLIDQLVKRLADAMK
jgi:zinc/manganese transport system substrate-binding protein